MQTIGNLVGVLTRHAEPPVIAAAANGDDDPARAYVGRRVITGKMDCHLTIAGLHAIRTRMGGLDPASRRCFSNSSSSASFTSA